MLTKELRHLEVHKLVERTVHDAKPVTVEYAITEHGKTLIPLANTLIKYGLEHRKVMQSKNAGEK